MEMLKLVKLFKKIRHIEYLMDDDIQNHTIECEKIILSHIRKIYKYFTLHDFVRIIEKNTLPVDYRLFSEKCKSIASDTAKKYFVLSEIRDLCLFHYDTLSKAYNNLTDYFLWLDKIESKETLKERVDVILTYKEYCLSERDRYIFTYLFKYFLNSYTLYNIDDLIEKNYYINDRKVKESKIVLDKNMVYERCIDYCKSNSIEYYVISENIHETIFTRKVSDFADNLFTEIYGIEKWYPKK